MNIHHVDPEAIMQGSSRTSLASVCGDGHNMTLWAVVRHCDNEVQYEVEDHDELLYWSPDADAAANKFNELVSEFYPDKEL